MIPSTLLLTPVLLQAQASGGQSLLLGVVPWILMFGIFYVILILPMRKRQKALQQTIEGLKKGDRVITTGGIYGEVAAIDTTTLVLKVADNVKIKIAKSAIAGLEADGDKGGNG
jgi:preprotein translocase subunit YajC